MKSRIDMKNYIVGSLIVISAIVFALVIGWQINVNAQVEPTDRYFQKDFCITEKTLFDDVTYTSPQDPLSYDLSDCPTINLTVHRWNELTIGEQNLINARMSALGYEDITADIQQIGVN